jgi:two-component system sensor histidine kinase MprB
MVGLAQTAHSFTQFLTTLARVRGVLARGPSTRAPLSNWPSAPAPTLRVQVVLLVTAAVALVAVAASLALYLSVERQMLATVDQGLVETARSARLLGPRPDDRSFPQAGRATLLLSGRFDVFAQVLDPQGNVLAADGQAVPAIVTADVRAVAAGQRSEAFSDVHTSGTHLRIYATQLSPGRTLELARRVDEIDLAMQDARVWLVVITASALLAAAAVAMLVARAVLGPVRRLADTVDEVTRTGDLSRRVAASGSDELAHLSQDFDAMLSSLEASLQTQRQLIADASHELRTPLTSVKTNLEVLARRGLSTDDEQALVTDLITQVDRLTNLVGDLIELGRYEELPARIEEVGLPTVVSDAIREVEGRYPNVKFNVSAKPSRVRAIRPRLLRAVVNLLDNAAKWSPHGETVEVTVGDGEFAVRDHGPGVKPEDIPFIFNRFWRSSEARRLPGSGLGLAIVKEVVDAHGGTISVEQPEGGGALFRVQLGSNREWRYRVPQGAGAVRA